MKRRKFIALLGGATTWPIVARSEQRERTRRIGVLMGYAENDPESRIWINAFENGLQERGWTVGRTISIDYRWSGGSIEQMRTHSLQLAAANLDAVLAASSPAVAMMKQATASVPTVFVNVVDPVGQGLVASLAHPGGNITGFTAFEFSMAGKWIEILKMLQPGLDRAVVLFHPETAPYYPLYREAIEAGAATLGVSAVSIAVRDVGDIETAVSGVGGEPRSGLVVVPSAFMTVHRNAIIALAARWRLPAIYAWNYYATSGGLISYGVDAPDLFRRASFYIDQILKGTKPADLPIQQPTKFELVVNLKAAKAIGLDVPPTLLARADEVIE